MNVENQDVLLDLEEEEEEEEDDDGEIVLELNQVIIPTYGTVPDQQNLHTPEWADFDNKPDSLFFSDGQRRIDFVLVYEDESKKMTHKRSDRRKQKRKRQVYESNLINNGLQLEATRSVLDEKLIFVKVHAPWEVLCTYAEVMHIKLPLQPNDLKTRDSAFNWFSRLFRVDENIIKPEQEFFTAPFEKEHLSNFYIQDKDTFFNPATRSRIVHFILSRVEYATKNNVKKFGINKLLDAGIYKAAFPLHDSSFRHLSTDPDCPSERYLLYKEWAHPKNIFKLQPLDFIRKYYGEKIGIYFAWLGFYTNMLIVAAVVGVGCFLYGCLTKDNCTWSQEVCDPNIGGNIIMCPQCDKVCTYWNLTITCESSKKLCIFDSFGTLVFAVFMGIWGINALDQSLCQCCCDGMARLAELLDKKQLPLHLLPSLDPLPTQDQLNKEISLVEGFILQSLITQLRRQSCLGHIWVARLRDMLKGALQFLCEMKLALESPDSGTSFVFLC